MLEEKLYDTKKDRLKTAAWIGAGLLAGALILSPGKCAGAEGKFTPSYQRGRANIDPIIEAAKSRGYLTVDELQTGLSTLRRYQRGEDFNSFYQWHPFFAEAVNNDLFPFKAMFYLSLEKGKYEEAELIRKNWIDCLDYLKISFDNLIAIARRHSVENKFNINISQKLQLQIEKLNTPGLTDSLIITLKEELYTAIKDKKWDDAQKIQNIITGRIKELQPSQQQLTDKRTLEDRTTVVVQQPSQPSQPYIQVEQMPRYGAEDIGRAISIFEGRGGKLDPKAEGTLKLLDILLQR